MNIRIYRGDVLEHEVVDGPYALTQYGGDEVASTVAFMIGPSGIRLASVRRIEMHYGDGLVLTFPDALLVEKRTASNGAIVEWRGLTTHHCAKDAPLCRT